MLADEFNQVGINLDFAPVLDVNVNPNNPIIGAMERSFSADPNLVAQHAQAFAEVFKQQGIMCSYKHFPGHGSSTNDSHKGFVDVSRTWTASELIPYRRLLSKALCDFVMMAHIYDGKLDKKYPATLSKWVIQDLLRKRLKFEGIVITDALRMDAIAKQYSLRESIKLAINAGNDMLLFSNSLGGYDPKLGERLVLIIEDLVAKGEVSEARINDAYQRIMAVKEAKLT